MSISWPETQVVALGWPITALQAEMDAVHLAQQIGPTWPPD